MQQSDFASEAAIDRLRQEIAYSRERIAMAMRLATPESGTQSEPQRVGRLFQVFQAVGEA